MVWVSTNHNKQTKSYGPVRHYTIVENVENMENRQTMNPKPLSSTIPCTTHYTKLRSKKLERFSWKNDFLINSQPLKVKRNILYILNTKIAVLNNCNLQHCWLQLLSN